MIRGIIKKIMNLKPIYPTNTFKVVGVSGEPGDKNTHIIYQVSGKATITTEKPETLMRGLMEIKGFSKQDAVLIYDLFMAEKSTPEFKILSIQFDDDPIKFEIEDVHSKYTLQLTAEEIVGSPKILEKFSHHDLTMVYFQLLKENEERRKASKSALQKKSLNEVRESSIYVLRNIGVNE